MDIRDFLNKIDKIQSKKDLTSEVKKINLTEQTALNISMYGTDANEINQMMQIFKSAGLQPPVPAKIDVVAAPAEQAVGEDERYQASTTPEPKYATVGDTVDPSGDDIHKKKKMYARSHPGDNPMGVKEEQNSLAEKIKEQLKQDYIAYKEGAVKGWLMDMESDAAEMTRDEFIKKHGQRHADIWDRVNSENPDSNSDSFEDIELE